MQNPTSRSFSEPDCTHLVYNKQQRSSVPGKKKHRRIYLGTLWGEHVRASNIHNRFIGVLFLSQDFFRDAMGRRISAVEYPERVRLGVQGVLHQIYLVIRLHQEIQVLESLPWKEGFHVVIHLAVRVLLRVKKGTRNEKKQNQNKYISTRRQQPGKQNREGTGTSIANVVCVVRHYDMR